MAVRSMCPDCQRVLPGLYEDAPMTNLQDMAPRMALQDMEDRCLSNAIPLCKCILRNGASRIEAADFTHIIVRQRRSTMPFTNRSSIRHTVCPVIIARLGSAFHSCITNVISESAEEEVIGTNAARRITVVADKQTIRDRAMRQHPRDAMGKKTAARQSERSIADSGPFRPQPAGFGFVHLRPKAINVFWGKMGVHRKYSFPVSRPDGCRRAGLPNALNYSTGGKL
jgi:hypothetical protein